MLEVMSRRERRTYWLLVSIWILANLVFWQWWFKKEHIVSWVMFALTSLALFYETTFLPSAYIFFVGKMKKTQAGLSPKESKGGDYHPLCPIKRINGGDQKTTGGDGSSALPPRQLGVG